MSKKVLVVDDERTIVKGIKFSLEQDDFVVDCAYDGEEAVDMAKHHKYDIILLDLMLPVMSGLDACQQIREFSNVPIIMLTAKGDDMDKILGLENGADDYITKPFNILEVKARIKAIIRRSAKATLDDKCLQFGDLKIYQEYRRVFINDKEIDVTVREYELLEYLAVHAGKPYTRDMLMDVVWNKDWDFKGDARTVDVHIRRLREKLESNPSEPQYIRTKWGSGYYFQA